MCNIWDLLIYSFVFKILLNTASYSFAILSTLKLFTAAAESRFAGMLTPEEEKLMREIISEYV